MRSLTGGKKCWLSESKAFYKHQLKACRSQKLWHWHNDTMNMFKDQLLCWLEESGDPHNNN